MLVNLLGWRSSFWRTAMGTSERGQLPPELTQGRERFQAWRRQRKAGGRGSPTLLAVADPFAGAVFVFRNRKATALKGLMYDGQGFWLCHKRLSQGRFPWWPSAAEGGAQRLAAHQLSVLLSAGNPTRTGAAADWRPVGPLT